MATENDEMILVKPSENGSKCEAATELELSNGLKFVLLSIKLLGLIPHTAFLIYVVYLARYELEHWYYFPFAAQFWWGVIALFILSIFELSISLSLMQRSIKRGTSRYVPKTDAKCSRCN